MKFGISENCTRPVCMQQPRNPCNHFLEVFSENSTAQIVLNCRPSSCDVNCMVTTLLRKKCRFGHVYYYHQPFLLWKNSKIIIPGLLLLPNSDILKQHSYLNGPRQGLYFRYFMCKIVHSSWNICEDKVHIFWEGHKILRNLLLTFDWHYIGQK